MASHGRHAHDGQAMGVSAKREGAIMGGHDQILDFDLAKLTQAEAAGVGLSALPTTPAFDPAQARPHTQAGVVLGTVGYMAPEQVRGDRADHRADIFAFGAVLYEMIFYWQPTGG